MKKTKLLKRERINHILSSVYSYPLTIVNAPIGFGKTTAVREFIKADGCPYFWITFLNSEESTEFLWNQFANKICEIDEEKGLKLKSLGFPIDVPQTLKIISILEKINFKEKTIFILDDYHLLKGNKLFNFIKQIIFEEIDNLHIIIITRETINIDYSELLSKGMCQIVLRQQLKFTEEELRTYCLMMDKNILNSDLKKINDYTDGWISLAYMLMVGLKYGIKVGMNSSIDELIENTIFNAYDDNTKNFLFKLSLVDDFTAKQAAYVTKEEKAAEILKMLQKENAFIFYDNRTQKYKIHNVFLDFLRLKQNFNEEELKGIYRRLGEWYLKKDPIISYAYFYNAKDVERILSELNKPANVSNYLTEFEGSFEMFESIPCELLFKYPIAYLQHIFRSILKGTEEIRMNCLNKLDNLMKFYEQADVEESYRNRIMAEILVVKKFTLFNHIEEMGMYNERILKLLNGRKSYILLRQNEFTFGCPHLLYIYFRDKGTFEKIFTVAKDKISIHSKISDGCGTGCEYVASAEYSLETGKFKDVELNSYKAIYKAETKSQTGISICAYFSLMRLYIFEGKVNEAICKLNELEELVEKENSRIYNTTYDICKGYIYACLKHDEKIPYWLQTGKMNNANFLYEGMAFNYIVYGKSVMLSKNYLKLEMLTESFCEYFSIFKNQLGFIHNSIFKAVAKYNLYGLEEGIKALQASLNMAREDNIIMPFVENAPHIIDILRLIENKNTKDEYVKEVMEYSSLYTERLQINKIDVISLSQKEREVLLLIAEGLKREEVASQLLVSKGTVRTHLQNIYKKLGVSGKVAAIKSAKMHKII